MKTNPYALQGDTTDTYDSNISSHELQQQPTPPDSYKWAPWGPGVESETNEFSFDRLVVERLEKAIDVCQKRGNQYGDTLKNGQWLVLRSVAKECGIELTIELARKLAVAALCDVKYQRFEGGYKEDHCDDGINYLACLAELMNSRK